MHSEALVPSFSAELHYIEAVAALLHETQLERGATSVYLTSQGTTFNEEVAGIRMMTDEARSEACARCIANQGIDRVEKSEVESGEVTDHVG